MPFKIVRNDITKMNTEAIVNTANDNPTVGTGCDFAVYKAAGYDELLKYRVDNIGYVSEGEAFVTPGFNLMAKYIIHAVSPLYIDGEHGEEDKLRSCYKNSLRLAKENSIKSIAFPLISTGGFGYPKEEGMRIAADEINAFLLGCDMEIYLVVFDNKATQLGEKIYPALEAYIDHNYVKSAHVAEYVDACIEPVVPKAAAPVNAGRNERASRKSFFERILQREVKADKSRTNYSEEEKGTFAAPFVDASAPSPCASPMGADMSMPNAPSINAAQPLWDEDALDELNKKLDERLAHRSDTFSEYLLYLIEIKGMSNVDVYKRAIVDKRYFAKLKNDKYFHPDKIKALCLCVGAKLNLDETKDLLARAGYALSPSDMTDIIFSFFIEHNHFDVIDIDIQLEEHGLKPIIT